MAKEAANTEFRDTSTKIRRRIPPYSSREFRFARGGQKRTDSQNAERAGWGIIRTSSCIDRLIIRSIPQLILYYKHRREDLSRDLGAYCGRGVSIDNEIISL